MIRNNINDNNKKTRGPSLKQLGFLFKKGFCFFKKTDLFNIISTFRISFSFRPPVTENCPILGHLASFGISSKTSRGVKELKILSWGRKHPQRYSPV